LAATELHAKEFAFGECAPQTSGLRDQSPVRDMKKEKKKRKKEKIKKKRKENEKIASESNYANNSNLYPIITKLTDHACRVKVAT